MNDVSARARAAVGVGVILIVLTGSHAAPLHFGFVGDDHDLIIDNGYAARSSSIVALFDGRTQAIGVPGSRYPVAQLSMMLDRALFGLRPAGYHLQSVLWHALCVLLLGWVVLRASGKRSTAWWCAVVFATLPAHVAAVGVINARGELIATAAVLGAIAVMQSGRLLGVIPILVVIGALAADAGFGALLLCPAFALLASERRAALRVSAAAAIALSMVVLLRWWWPDAATMEAASPSLGGALGGDVSAISTAPGWEVWLRSVIFSFEQLFVPSQQGVMFTDALPSWPSVGTGFALVAVLAATVWYAVRRREITLWLVGAIGVVALVLLLSALRLPQSIDTRMLYLPSAALAMFIGGALTAAQPRLSLRIAVVFVVMAGLFLHHVAQQGLRDDRTVWRRTVVVQPNSPSAWAGLATTQLREGRIERAERVITRGRKMAPGNTRLLTLEAVTACLRNDAASAEALFAQVEGREGDAWLLLQQASCLLRLGKPIRAHELAVRAGEAAPWMADPHMIEGLALHSHGQPRDAELALRRGVDIAPDREDLWFLLLRFYETVDEPAKAKALRLEAGFDDDLEVPPLPGGHGDRP